MSPALPGRWSPGRAVLLRALAWVAVMVTYLTLRSAGLGWTVYWWAWLFVLAPVGFGGLSSPVPSPAPRAADGFVAPRVRSPTSHRRRPRTLR